MAEARGAEPLGNPFRSSSVLAMGAIKEFLDEHLRPMAGPYVFVGAGFSRRYADLFSWNDLLEEFAAQTGQPLDYYRSAAGGSLPGAASRLATAFHEHWWRSEDYAESRAAWAGKTGDSVALPLKIEVSRLLQARLQDWEPSEELVAEWALVQSSAVDGVITTNYDDLLSLAFPDYKVFVGQDGLLFSDTQGIAEIYAIHGATSDPDSIVLTQEDYDAYEERNAYLAAKLMTIFVEHPVVFLGYSFGDANIQSMLLSLVRGLKDKSVEKLQDRLIFVEWHADLPQGPYVEKTFANVEGQVLPVIRVHVTDWVDVFTALGERPHALSARTLRHLKEQVYDIVLTNDPKGRLYAHTDIDSTNADDVEIVFGVGARLQAVGLVGLRRIDIWKDVLEMASAKYSAEDMLSTLYPTTVSTTCYPIYKYLRVADKLNDAGTLVDEPNVDAKVVSRELRNRAAVKTSLPGVSQTRSIIELEETEGLDWILNNSLKLPAYTDDVDGLGDFLLRHANRGTDGQWWPTQYGKAVVAFDFMKYGPGASEG